ncbi:hypothetical protein JI58_06560 [Marinosulfonomonas sp. PRT-SC04]|nr:hypothetical protein JI58_06560 [Marinosulfonomonas sp. PRT-SC04]
MRLREEQAIVDQARGSEGARERGSEGWVVGGARERQSFFCLLLYVKHNFLRAQLKIHLRLQVNA